MLLLGIDVKPNCIHSHIISKPVWEKEKSRSLPFEEKIIQMSIKLKNSIGWIEFLCKVLSSDIFVQFFFQLLVRICNCRPASVFHFKCFLIGNLFIHRLGVYFIPEYNVRHWWCQFSAVIVFYNHFIIHVCFRIFIDLAFNLWRVFVVIDISWIRDGWYFSSDGSH